MKSIISFYLLFFYCFSVAVFAQRTPEARYNTAIYQKLNESQTNVLTSEALKASVATNPQLATQIYEVTAKVMAMNKFGKIQYLKNATQCLVDGKVILPVHKDKIDGMIAATLHKDKKTAQKLYTELTAIDNAFVKELVTNIKLSNEGSAQAQSASGATIGSAIGTIVGGTIGLIAGGVAGGIGGATLGGTVGKAIGTLLDNLFGGGKNNDDDDHGDGDDSGGDSGGDNSGGGDAAKQAGGGKKAKNWVKCPTLPTTCGAAPY